MSPSRNRSGIASYTRETSVPDGPIEAEGPHQVLLMVEEDAFPVELTVESLDGEVRGTAGSANPAVLTRKVDFAGEEMAVAGNVERLSSGMP
ncbi:hypothetical protein [Herbiconiux sp.]|uniref:hypothetical protein n=1 Tax=Herbiconiux sp. TaxID=1871186 RepID=UPI0025BCDA7B|nr:hypothetical protein [Herbiconiux sp.]